MEKETTPPGQSSVGVVHLSQKPVILGRENSGEFRLKTCRNRAVYQDLNALYAVECAKGSGDDVVGAGQLVRLGEIFLTQIHDADPVVDLGAEQASARADAASDAVGA